MNRFRTALLGVMLCLLSASAAIAQTTGSINGTVADDTGGMLPGVTVTATSPALMGVQTAVTNENGAYRFPSVPPGTYTITYELAGFQNVRREGIVVNLGFTATVNVQLQVASLQETVTVSGASPVVDVTSTTSTFNVTQDMLQTLPNARDIWSVMGQSPGVRVSRIDVGGSRAGTQTGFEAFGFSGQVRIQIDGVNTTEGTGSAGFYYDYGAFDEIQLGSDGNDAQAATPGVQLNAVVKSGGNQVKGTIYADYQNENLQGRNIDDRLASLGIGEGTRTLDYYDLNGDVGGPLKRDKLWYYMSLRRQDSTVTVSGFPVENPGDFGQLTSLQNGTYKLSYQLSPNNRISHYIQYGRKLLPERGGSSTRYRWTVNKQDSGSWAGNVEWNSILGPKFFFRTALSSFGYNFPQVPYGPNGEEGSNLDHRITDAGSGTTFTKGSEDYTRTDRRRWQFNWDGQMFQDNWLGGNHTIKVGFLSERESNEATDGGFLDALTLSYNSTGGLPNFTTPYRVQIRNTPRVQYNANWHHGAYINDSIQLAQRFTVSLGVRWDYYSSFFPDQLIPETRWRDFFYAGVPVQTSVGAYSLPRTAFADNNFTAPGQSGIREYPALIAPRFGLSWDVQGNGKTLVKANWGRFHHNTGNASGDLNPLRSATATFDWLDCRTATGTPTACAQGQRGDGLFQDSEFGQNRAVTGVGGVSSTIDPDIKDPYTDSMSFWFERELASNLGFRAGYTFRTDRNNSESVELNRVYSLFTLARTFADPGIDGIVGTSDDGPAITWWDIPGQAPASRTELRTVAEELADDRAIDFTLTKRMSDRWSLVTSYYYNWDRDARYIQDPNDERFADETVTNWNFKVFGSYQAPWGIVTTGSVRHQSGTPISRDVALQGQPGQNITATGTDAYEAEQNGTYRTDNVTVFDAKIERRFRFGGRSLSAFVDAFNILNTNAADIGQQSSIVGRPTVTLADGSRVQVQGFLRPTAIVPPRIFRFGMRLNF
jgi:hypothetical protein